MRKKDCVILGAGLSGLAAGITLNRKNVDFLILEANDQVGGRVRSKTTENGFIIDEGFQVILNSYPELSNFVDLSKLDLRLFNSGALIFNGSQLELLANPMVHPETLISSLFQQTITFKDKALVLKLIAYSKFVNEDSPVGEKATLDFLKEFGFSTDFIELFWRPFLTGIYLDSELKVGDNFFKFLMRCFSSGKVTIPEKGMQKLPELMRQSLPAESILFNRSVKNVTQNSVTLEDGEIIEARKVICAFDPSLLDSTFPKSSYNSVATYYFTSSELDIEAWRKWLILIPPKFGWAMDHMVLISSVAESYGNGQNLLSVSVVGNKIYDMEKIKSEVNQLANKYLHLNLVASTIVKKALPQSKHQNEAFKVQEGVVYCGDRWSSPSINGALRSGRLAAEFVIEKLSV
jgi:hypothetical protein